jgi:hypothetical protein
MRLLCASLAFGAMAAEIPINHQPAQGAAPRDQYDAVVASNGEQSLVVWGDERAGVRQTYATRVARDGTVLDPNGFRVASDLLTRYVVSSFDINSPRHVIWGGKSWFVLSSPCGSLSLVRVGTDGTVLDPTPRFYSYGTCDGLSVASNGHYVVVGYQTNFAPYEQYALFLDSDGQPLTAVRLSPGNTGQGGPQVAASGSSFVAVWKDRAVRFDRDGILGSRPVSFADPANGAMRIASDGADMLVVRGKRGFRLSADLVAEPLADLPFTYVHSITWTGSDYLVAGIIPTTKDKRSHTGDVNIVRLDRNGGLLAQHEVRTDGVTGHWANGLAVTGNRENVLIAWHDPTEAARPGPTRDADVFLSVVSPSELTPGPPKLLSVAADAQLGPVTAASGSQLLTVWKEAAGIYARRHWRDGRADGAPIRLTGDATSMDVAFNGTDFIVATTEEGRVVTRQLAATGELRVQRTWRAEGEDARAIALATGGGVTLAAWFDHDSGVRAARVTANGSLVGIPLEIASDPLAREAPSIEVSPNGVGEFLVVWGGSTPGCVCDPPFIPSRSGVLRAARVTSALVQLDRPAIEIAAPIAADDPRANPDDPRYDALHSLKADHPSALWNGQEWLVVWNRGFRSVSGVAWEEIRGRRIAPNGTLMDGSADDAGVLVASNGFAPTVAWTGSRYVLAWYEAMPFSNSSVRWDRLHQIRTALFENLGGPLSNERTIGEAAAGERVSIAVVSGFPIFAYSRLGEDHVYGGVPRAFLDVPVFPPAPRRRAVRR